MWPARKKPGIHREGYGPRQSGQGDRYLASFGPGSGGHSVVSAYGTVLIELNQARRRCTSWSCSCGSLLGMRAFPLVFVFLLVGCEENSPLADGDFSANGDAGGGGFSSNRDAGGGSGDGGGGDAPLVPDTGDAGLVPPSTARVDNPYAGALGYVNEDWSQEVLSAAASETGALKTAMEKVSQQATFVWMDRIGAIAGSASAKGLEAHLDAALEQQQRAGSQVVFQVVIYDLPNRDCSALASNGELSISDGGITRYKSEYIDVIAGILVKPKYASLRIATVVEVDSLPNLITNASVPKCQEAAGPGGYVEGVRYALDTLSTISNVYNYIDISHSGWLGWDDNRTKAVSLLVDVIGGTQRKWDSVAGFASNSANYTPTEEPNLSNPDLNVGGQPLRSAKFYEWNPAFDELDFVTTIRSALIAAGAPERIGMLIDTGRNGWGGSSRPTSASGSDVNAVVDSGRVDRRLHRGNWCNQVGTGIGERPTSAPKLGIHAYVWVKPPGESDGISTETPNGPNEEGKQHDPMCSPEYVGTQQANGGHKTGATLGAPHAGVWFPEHFKALVQNAFPQLSEN